MATSIKDTLKESTKDLLSEDTLDQIEAVFNEAVEAKAQLQVGAALVKQDDDHAKKVQQLLEAIDDDHAKKLDKIVEAINDNHSTKLRMIVEKYESVINNEAVTLKSSLVDSISNYLELYLEKTFPGHMIEEAVNNKRSESVLKEVRKLLGVDLALAKDTIRDAITDGKKQITESQTELGLALKENNELKQKVADLEALTTLNTLSVDLDDDKKTYITRVFDGKDAEFIKENFEYTLSLFDKDQAAQIEQLKEEATQTVEGKVDTVIESVEVQNENLVQEDADDNDPFFNSYMGELGKY